MKKYLFPIITSLALGTFMSAFIISNYENKENIVLSKNAQTVFYIQSGVYSNIDNMKKAMSKFTHYIYNVEENKYYTYIGVTTDKTNAKKIKEYYKKKGYDTYIKEKIIDNKQFIKILNQYDSILKETNDEKTILTICNQILTNYEELINNEY